MSATFRDKGNGRWRAVVTRYQRPDVRHAVTQVATTLLLLLAALSLMCYTLESSYWLTIVLALPTAGLLVRTFVIMHDCAHGSFLPWRRANDAVGFVTGVLTLTPFEQWRRDHALHHASSGDLDRRGRGDIRTLTVREYLARTRWGQLRYRLFRHPAVLLGLGPLHLMVAQRLGPRRTATRTRQIASVSATNAAIAIAVAVISFTVGLRAVLLVYLPAYYLSAVAGIWLFYVQHQFEDAYWETHDRWDYATAAIAGSSYFKLPRILNWFTGSIGLHHVHHLGPRIPNYNLQRCHDENPLFHDVPVVTLARSAKVLRLGLWDEERRRLIRFAEVSATTAAS